MALYLLDTDHISLVQRGDKNVTDRYDAVPEQEIIVSVVSYEEQLRGRLVIVSQAKTKEQLARAYWLLLDMQVYFCGMRVVDFGKVETTIYESLRKLHRRTGTMDLRIAATALAHNAILVTRNTQDFAEIENLKIENWA
jgi:tRNA(fMet)-specific endonuclease VapC